MADGKQILGTDGKFLFTTAGEFDICEICCGTACENVATCNCTSGNNTYPRLKVTLCWTGAASTKSYMGCTWTNGESKLICPDQYNVALSTTTNPTTNSGWQETWIKGTGTGTSNTLSLKNGFQGSGSDNFTQNLLRVSGSALGTWYLYLFNWILTPSTATNKRTYTSNLTGTVASFYPSTAPQQGALDTAGVQSGQMGFVTDQNGVTVQWKAVSGNGQSWDNWRREGVGSDPLTVADPCCIENMQAYPCDICNGKTGQDAVCGNCCSCESGKPDIDVSLTVAEWQASTAYVLNDYVLSTAGDLYQIQSSGAGTSGSTEPTWDTTIGNTTSDNTATWTRVDNTLSWLCLDWDMSTENGYVKVACPVTYEKKCGTTTTSSVPYCLEKWVGAVSSFSTTPWLYLLGNGSNSPTASNGYGKVRVATVDSLNAYGGEDSRAWAAGVLVYSIDNIGIMDKTVPFTYSNYRIRDNMFGSYTKFGVTYTWSRGNNW